MKNNKTDKKLSLAHFTIQHALDAIFWVDSNSRIHKANDAACQLTGFSMDELLSKKIYEISPEFDDQSWIENWEMIKTTKKYTKESFYNRKDGTKVPVEVSANYLTFEGKEYVCSFVRDITERKRAETDIQNAYHEIEQLKNKLQDENTYLKEEIKLTHNFEEIITQNHAVRKILESVERVATTDATVLITGETGTGKELIARAIHNISKRHKYSLLKVNCAALPSNLIESELFGHEKGAFTGAHSRKIGRFELANNGTIFLDEIGELPLDIQAKLLKVLQDSKFERLGDSQTRTTNVRIIAATNRDLENEIKKGQFRNDLFYRLNVFPIYIPPLRMRNDDIPLLTRYFVKKYCKKHGKNIERVPQSLLDKFQTYQWPGNIRELENIIERAIIISKSEKLEIGDWLKTNDIEIASDKLPTFQDNERQHILNVLNKTNWRVSGPKGAAKILNINPQTLFTKLKKLNIHR